MRSAILALAMTAAACAAPQDTAEQPAEQAAAAPEEGATSGDVPAPVEAGVARTITIEQAGQTVTVAVGERFAVALVGTPTAGYLWEVQDLPAFLTRAGEGGGPTRQEQTRPGFAGGNHWDVTYYAATEAGEGALTLVQRRPWEREAPPSQTFTVTIRAQ